MSDMTLTRNCITINCLQYYRMIQRMFGKGRINAKGLTIKCCFWSQSVFRTMLL